MPSQRWLVAGVATHLEHGGHLRARHIFRALARRTGATVTPGIGARAIASALARRPGLVRGRLAAARLLSPAALRLARVALRASVLDFHDNPVLQPGALGLPIEGAERDRLERAMLANLRSFERLLVPSESAVALSSLPPDRTIVVPNGTDTSAIRPAPLPDEPVVGMVSGAAPGRGIEMLMEAVELVRREIPEARLAVGLAASGPASRGYLDALRRSAASTGGVSIEEVPYQRLSDFLARALVLCVPHPAGDYMDAAMPVKLFDSMAAGRPLVVTPRFETARVIAECKAGLVSASDAGEDLAGALMSLLTDRERAAELGRNARVAAVERYDWGILSEQLADRLLST